jgi:hypothetical protein
MTAKFVEINGYSGAPFSCPICGREIFTPEGEAVSAPCDHLVFSWLDLIGEFLNPSPEVARLAAEWENDPEPETFPWDKEFHDLFADSVVMFGCATRGVACGPVGAMLVHAVKFPTGDNDVVCEEVRQ